MSKNGLIAAVILAVVVMTMTTSIQLSTYASPTTEDDGWTEGDYEGSEEEQEDQAQEDWEDAGRPGDNDDDDEDDEDDEDPYAGLPTPEKAGEIGVVDCGNGVFVNPQELCPQDEQEPVLVLCSDGQTQVEEDRVDEDCPETSQVSANGLPLCNGTFQDCVTENGDVCVAGSAAHECEDLGEEQELIDCNTYPESEYCNSEKGRDGLPFCDLVSNAESCYDRNDNPEEYCSKYSNSDSDFCKIIR